LRRGQCPPAVEPLDAAAGHDALSRARVGRVAARAHVDRQRVGGRPKREPRAARRTGDVDEMQLRMLSHGSSSYDPAGSGTGRSVRRCDRVRQASKATTSAIAATTAPKISKVDCREMYVTDTPARMAGTDSDPYATT